MRHNEYALQAPVVCRIHAPRRNAVTTLRVGRHRARRWLIAFGIVVVLGVAGTWVFLRAGTWLVFEDPLEPSPVAVVFSGGIPGRAREAAEIYRTGNAQQIWIT